MSHAWSRLCTRSHDEVIFASWWILFFVRISKEYSSYLKAMPQWLYWGKSRGEDQENIEKTLNITESQHLGQWRELPADLGNHPPSPFVEILSLKDVGWLWSLLGDPNLNMPELPEPTPHQPDQLFLPHPAICIGLQLVPFRKQLLKEKHEGRSSYAGFAAKCKWDSLQVDYQSFEREWKQNI